MIGRRGLLPAVLGLLLLLPAAAEGQTAAQLADQLSALVKQLQAALTPPPVVSSAGLAAALQQGGTIVLAPGTYVGNFVIAKPTQLSGPASALLKPADPLSPTLQVQANDVVVSGLSIQLGAPDRDCIDVGTLSATSAAAQPHRVRFVGTQVLPSASGGGHRGFALHGSDITLQSVSVSGYYEKGRDSQAVWIDNGPGPYAILDSVLEASGENILLGGADPGIAGMNPANITITGNTLRKPDSFRALGTVKNNFELKMGVHVLFQNNTLDGNWADGQNGTPIQITVRNQDGACAWCLVDDVTIRGNTTKRTTDGFAVNILGTDDANASGQMQTLVIDHNLFADSPNGFQVLNGVAAKLQITNNTLPAITGKFFSFSSSKKPAVISPLSFSNNVLRSGDYGITGDGTTAVGLPSLLAFAQVVDFSGNIIEMTAARTIALPAGVIAVKAGGLPALLDPTTFKLLSGSAGY